jgi:TRAP-type C4-dicarboxylate transport system substrate-binding protein
MPISQVYNALNQDVIDGVLTGPIGGHSFKLTELGRYYTTGLPFGRLPFFLAMNKRTWSKLSPAHKKVITDTTGRALALRATNGHVVEGNKVIAFLKKKPNVTFIEIKGQELAKAEKIMARVRDQLIKKLDAKGVPGSRIFAVMQK